MSETSENFTTLMDALSSNACFVRTLLESAYDKTRFYLSDQKLLGPYRDVLASHARELESLLVLTFQLMGQIEQDAETLSSFVYKAGIPA